MQEQNNVPVPPSIPESAPTMVQPTVDPVETKQSPVLMSILVILLVLSLGGVFYFVFQNMQLQKQIASLKASPTPVAYVSPSPIAIPSSTTYTTYTNESKKVSFNYPTNWGVFDKFDSGKAIIIAPLNNIATIQKQSDMGSVGGSTYFVMEVYVYDKETITPNPTSNDLVSVTKTSANINGYEGEKFISTYTNGAPGIPSGSLITTYVIKTNNFNYHISLLDKNYQSDFDQILSTFKFTK